MIGAFSVVQHSSVLPCWFSDLNKYVDYKQTIIQYLENHWNQLKFMRISCDNHMMNGKLMTILPRLLQRSKKCRGHYSTIYMYHATSQGYWEVIHISLFDTMLRNPCILSSKSCQLHVYFTSWLCFWPGIFRISM